MTTSPMKQDETESDITFDVLKKWNLRAGIVHLVQAVLMLLASQLVPRIRDFRGINPKGFDGRGNYSMGVSDQSIFPEIELDKVKRTQGMDITIVTTANTNAEAKDLLARLGMPFADKEKQN